MTRIMVSDPSRHGENPPSRRKRGTSGGAGAALAVHADSIGRSLERVEAFVVCLEIDATDAELERYGVEELREAVTAIRDGVSRLRAEALLAGEGRKRGRRRPVPAPPASGTLTSQARSNPPMGSGEGHGA